jgi:hypothetical protein
MALQHRTVIRKGVSLTGRFTGVIAYCKTCGWESRPQQTELAADIEGDAHATALS